MFNPNLPELKIIYENYHGSYHISMLPCAISSKRISDTGYQVCRGEDEQRG